MPFVIKKILLNKKYEFEMSNQENQGNQEKKGMSLFF